MRSCCCSSSSPHHFHFKAPFLELDGEPHSLVAFLVHIFRSRRGIGWRGVSSGSSEQMLDGINWRVFDHPSHCYRSTRPGGTRSIYFCVRRVYEPNFAMIAIEWRSGWLPDCNNTPASPVGCTASGSDSQKSFTLPACLLVNGAGIILSAVHATGCNHNRPRNAQCEACCEMHNQSCGGPNHKCRRKRIQQ